MRRSGVLLPIASLPSKYGIGCFSKEAYEFVDFLVKAGQQLWQILPLGPTGYGDSPYQSFSTYAGNPYFIDLEKLIEKGWLTKAECDSVDFGDNEQYIDYEKIYLNRFSLLRKAFEKSEIEKDSEYKEFCKRSAFWLEDYCLYMAVKNSYDGKAWIEWDEPIRTRQEKAMKEAKETFAEEIEFYSFLQYLFTVQWKALKAYANGQGIKIVGDIPIYVAFDSSDTWASPELFQLDDECVPTAVAGCPPDAFSATGQLWGNPLYRWDYHRETGFKWWMKRLEHCFSLYDVLRIDHFRGFDEYYSIPYGDETAEFGHWEKGPGIALFDTMKKELGEREVIAEDLGYLTESVIRLVKDSTYPGMKVLLFAFDAREPSDYLPHNYKANSVVYTGTHDNDTIEGWIKDANPVDVAFSMEYCGVSDKKDLRRALIRSALGSVSDTCVIPIQDYLGLDNAARTNKPSTLGTNWKWRLRKEDIPENLAGEMNRLVTIYGRALPKKAAKAEETPDETPEEKEAAVDC